MSASRARMAAHTQTSHLIPATRKKEKVEYSFPLLLSDLLKLHMSFLFHLVSQNILHMATYLQRRLDNVAFILVNHVSDLKLGILILGQRKIMEDK